jgi:hypothetical protein
MLKPRKHESILKGDKQLHIYEVLFSKGIPQPILHFASQNQAL